LIVSFATGRADPDREVGESGGGCAAHLARLPQDGNAGSLAFPGARREPEEHAMGGSRSGGRRAGLLAAPPRLPAPGGVESARSSEDVQMHKPACGCPTHAVSLCRDRPRDSTASIMITSVRPDASD